MAQKWKLIFIFIVMILIGDSCYVGPEFNITTFSDDCFCKDVPSDNCTSYDCDCKKIVCLCEDDLHDCVSDSCDYKNSSAPCNCAQEVTPTDLCNTENNPVRMKAIEKASAHVNRDLAVLTDEDWDKYSGSVDIKNGQFMVYECFWSDSPEEWVIYKRQDNVLYWYRFYK